jgi:ankyrin repeat protein
MVNPAFCAVLGIIFVLFSSEAAVANLVKYGIEKLDTSDCGPVIGKPKTIDHTLIPLGKHQQGPLDTCFLFSSHYMVNYLDRLIQKEAGVQNSKSLAFVDAISQACKREFPSDGGRPYVLLHNLRNHQLAVEPYISTYERVYGNQRKIEKMLKSDRPDRVRACADLFQQDVLTPAASSLIQDTAWLSHTEKEILREPKKAVGKLLESMPGVERKSAPEYNIEVYGPQHRSDAQLIDRVVSAFSEEPPLPVNFNFCARYMVRASSGQADCEGVHSVVVTGIQARECKGVKKFEFEVIDSRPRDGKTQQWVSADALVAAQRIGGAESVFIHRCSPEGEKGLPKCSPEIQGDFPLTYLAIAGDKKQLSLAIEKIPNFDPNSGQYHPDGIPLLHVAADFNQTEIIELLLKKGAKINLKYEGLTALHAAIRGGNEEAAKKLIAQKADVNVTDPDGRTPLHDTVYSKNPATYSTNVSRSQLFRTDQKIGNIEIAKVLLDHHANINARDRQGMTALHMAANENQIEIAKLLVSRGADKKIEANTGFKAGDIAYLKERHRIFELLLENEDEDIDGPDRTHLAVKTGLVTLFKANVPEGTDLNRKNRDGKTLLMIAASQGDIAILETLISKFVNLREKDLEGRTALHLAAIQGHPRAVQVLLKHSSAVNAMDNLGRSPLHYAVERGDKETTKALLDKHANLDLQDALGVSPLELAVRGGHFDLVSELFYQGADPFVENKQSQTVLNLAQDTRMKTLIENRQRNFQTRRKVLIKYSPLISSDSLQGKELSPGDIVGVQYSGPISKNCPVTAKIESDSSSNPINRTFLVEKPEIYFRVPTGSKQMSVHFDKKCLNDHSPKPEDLRIPIQGQMR